MCFRGIYYTSTGRRVYRIYIVGSILISVGVFASALSENQVIAAIVSFVGLLIMWIADGIGGMVGGFMAKILYWFSLLSRYDDFNRGVLNLVQLFT